MGPQEDKNIKLENLQDKSDDDNSGYNEGKSQNQDNVGLESEMNNEANYIGGKMR